MNFIFVVNPKSGNGRGLKVIEAIKQYCKEIKAQYKIAYTSKKNEAQEIVKFYSKHNDNNCTIFSVGGDGTLNEVVNGIVKTDMNLGVIPSGTGNDFYRSLKDIKTDKIDVGKVNDRYFINVASLGLDAEIANYANDLKNNRLPSKLVYILGIIHEYFKFKPIDIDINDNNKKSTILTVCNAKFYGGGFKIAPEANLNDGKFDIIDVKSLNKLEIIKLISDLIKVEHLYSNKVNFYRTDNLVVDSLIPLVCNIDGEIIKDTNFNFSIKKEVINVDVENSNKIYEFLKIKKVIK